MVTVGMGCRLFGIRRLASDEERAEAKRRVRGFDENDGIESRWFFWYGAVMTLLFVAAIATTSIMPVIRERCGGCHSAAPDTPGFATAPLGIVLDQPAHAEAVAERIYVVTTQTRTMPLGNLTGMTDEERELIGRW